MGCCGIQSTAEIIPIEPDPDNAGEGNMCNVRRLLRAGMPCRRHPFSLEAIYNCKSRKWIRNIL